MPELKPGWRRVKFGEVVRLNKETCKDPAAEGIGRYVGLEHIEPGDLRMRAWGDVADGTTFTNRIRSGQVLFGKRRAYQRKVAVADFDAVCSGDIYVFDSTSPDHLLPELLPFICQAENFFEHAVGTSAGSLSPRTNWSSLAAYEFVLPPLHDQARIAKMLQAQDEVLSALRDARLASDRASRSFASDALMARGWPLRSLQDVCSTIVDCKNRTPPYTEQGFPVIRTSNIRNGRLLTDDLMFTSEAGYRVWTERAVPRASDLVFTREAPVGEACLIPEGIIPCLGQRTMLFRPDQKVLLPEFMLMAVLSHPVQQQLLRLAGGSTVGHVRVDEMKRLQVPVPGIDVQREVARQYAALRGSTTSLEQRAETAARMRRDALSMVWA